MHGGGSCSPCWMPAPLRHQKPRRRLLRTGHCSASGPTRSPQGEELTSKSPCQTVGSTALHVVKTLFQGTQGQSINLQLSESWCRFFTTSYYLWQIINNCWRSSSGCTKLILTTASEQDRHIHCECASRVLRQRVVGLELQLGQKNTELVSF